MATQGDLWAIVLAGGCGQRLEAFLRRQGHLNPIKQFCNIVGRRTMLQHTWARVEMLMAHERVLTVVGAKHVGQFAEQLARRSPGTVLGQPMNRETAPGTLLPLAQILRADPSAVVGIFPSDHFVLEERRLMARVWAASDVVRGGVRDLVILGARPTRADPDYGWIEVRHGQEIAAGVYGVESFREKPTLDTAARLYGAGHLWSTMVIVARAAALWELICESQPLLRRPFERIREALGTTDEAGVLAREYVAIPEVSLSRGVLENFPSRLGVMVLDGIYWSDWGREERVQETLQRLDWVFHGRQHSTTSEGRLACMTSALPPPSSAGAR